MNQKIEVRKGDKIYCVYSDESVLPSKDIMKSMKDAGYKFYQDGRLYKPEKNNK